MLIEVAVQNLQHGAVKDESGHRRDRWPLLAERLRRVRPDVLILNEARDWNRGGREPLGRAQRDLGMIAAPIPPSANDLPTIVLYRPDTMGFWVHCNDALSLSTAHGFVTVSFAVDHELPPITFAGCHLSPYSSGQATAEIELIATRAYRYGPLAVVAGDLNFPPEDGPDPLYDVMLPFNLASRTIVGPDGTRRPNRQVAHALRARGYHDTAWERHQRTGYDRYLRRTSHDDRIDRIHVSTPLAQAVTRYELLDQPEGASDHHGVTITMDTDLIDRTDLWTYR
ncbi:endonuclease/exonuclease/phosphatase family protein [Actinoplanes derwentensis]|uniref:Endonuclease/Exonuclease/phosphatase family protein n=1 Tax=Actinoplanes derwentensis TaxID=113562 RepID=A0A1H2CVI9_9ACTN|nr:endonuclease/exonuclease/phosphatase family protein [Actinoplanes derwentensis]GID82062.1 hypothetical protein Ade03nite_09860 [Actinoplanes derwentensis]SDT74515.1 Endonuclease/Exonuclease/phosphatase family protein [Actinoplanes derwentensis]